MRKLSTEIMHLCKYLHRIHFVFKSSISSNLFSLSENGTTTFLKEHISESTEDADMIFKYRNHNHAKTIISCALVSQEREDMQPRNDTITNVWSVFNISQTDVLYGVNALINKWTSLMPGVSIYHPEKKQTAEREYGLFKPWDPPQSDRRCANVLLPSDTIRIIPALHNKPDHSFSFTGSQLKSEHWV